MPERFAIYYAPALTHPLWSRALDWFGTPELQPLTVSARRYGFHATLKPPFALAPNTTRRDVQAKLSAFARAHNAVTISRMALRSIGGGFLALVPEAQARSLTDFAGDCVAAFEPFRAPPTLEERAKRLPGLSMRQIDLLDRYGYPYVMEQFQFHMTLTDRLTPEETESIMAAAQAHFAPDIGAGLLLDRLVLFHEPVPGAPFERLDDYPLMNR